MMIHDVLEVYKKTLYVRLLLINLLFLDRKLYFITISLFIIPAGCGAMMNKGKDLEGKNIF